MLIPKIALKYEFSEELAEKGAYRCAVCDVRLTPIGFLYASRYGMKLLKVCSTHHIEVQAFVKHIESFE